MLMSMGIHEGKPIDELPTSYLLWVAFQGTTKNGVVGCSDMPGGDNWEAITRPLR